MLASLLVDIILGTRLSSYHYRSSVSAMIFALLAGIAGVWYGTVRYDTTECRVSEVWEPRKTVHVRDWISQKIE